MISPRRADLISDTIFTLIPEVSRLRELFLSWSRLGEAERSMLDQLSCHSQLYRPLLQALQRWETLQETQGAPGCWPGVSSSFSETPHLEEELGNVVRQVETLLDNILSDASCSTTSSSASTSASSTRRTSLCTRPVQISSGYNTD